MERRQKAYSLIGKLRAGRTFQLPWLFQNIFIDIMAEKLFWPLKKRITPIPPSHTNLNSSVTLMLTCLSSSFTSYSLDHALNNSHDLFFKTCPFWCHQFDPYRLDSSSISSVRKGSQSLGPRLVFCPGKSWRPSLVPTLKHRAPAKVR